MGGFKIKKLKIISFLKSDYYNQAVLSVAATAG